ncbi:MAG: tetratricopeptide repeat protein, partial [Verrucomicrobiota bacterium]
SEEDDVAIPTPGDYESRESKEYQIAAGQPIEDITLFCTNRVAGDPSLYLGDETKKSKYLAQLKERSAAEEVESDAASQAIRKLLLNKHWIPAPAVNQPDAPIRLLKVSIRREPYDVLNLGKSVPTLAVDLISRQGEAEAYHRSALIDDHGCRFESRSFVSGGSAKQTIHFNNFPARQRFKLAVEDAEEKVFEFEIPRFFGEIQFPVWTPEPLPAVRTIATDETIHFAGLVERDMNPRFRFERTGQPSSEWEVESVAWIDPTGNETHDPRGLCRKESVLKLRAHLFRKQTGRFPPAQEWILANLNVPPDGQFTLLDQTNRLLGLDLKLVAVCGKGEFTYADRIPVSGTAAIDTSSFLLRRRALSSHHGLERVPDLFIKPTPGSFMPSPGPSSARTIEVVSKVPHLAVRIKGLKETHRIELVGGRKIQLRPQMPFPEGEQNQVRDRDLHLVPLPENSRRGSITLRFVAQKRRTAEFTVSNPAAVEESPKVKALRKQAEAGDAKAQYELAKAIENGEGTLTDWKSAEHWKKVAAENGHSPARFEWAEREIHAENPKAVQWMTELAEQGMSQAQVMMGWWHLGLGGGREEKDPAQAFRWFGKAAEQNNPVGQHGLAHCYRTGQGTAIDLKRAFALFHKAAEAGHAQAHQALGIMYWHGQGVEPNPAEAYRWLKKSPLPLNLEGCHIMGLMHRDGKGTAQNLVEAYQWFARGAYASREARLRRDELRERLTPEQVAQADAQIEKEFPTHSPFDPVSP